MVGLTHSSELQSRFFQVVLRNWSNKTFDHCSYIRVVCSLQMRLIWKWDWVTCYTRLQNFTENLYLKIGSYPVEEALARGSSCALLRVQPQLCSYLQSVKVKGCYVGQQPMTFFWYILILKMQGQITKSDWHCKKIETRYVNVRKSEKEGNWAWVRLEQVVHHWGREAYPELQSTTSAMLWTSHDKAIILWTRKASSELTDSFLYPMTTFHHKPISKKILKVLGRQQ